MVVAVTTAASVVLVVFGLFILLLLFAGGRLIWGLFRGDVQIGSSSWGRQYSRRRREGVDRGSE
jgi:uncharacterized membrane protein YqiK